MTDYITLTGRVGTDPELRTTQGGTTFATFRLATDRQYQDRATNEWIDKGTNWYSVTVWGAAGTHAHRSLAKGDPVVVVGRLELNSWSKEVQTDSGTETRSGTSAEVTAKHLGHDIARGVSTFARATSAPKSDAQAEEWAPSAEPATVGATAGGSREPEPATPF